MLIKALLFGAIMLVAGCAGTVVEYAGPLCGSTSPATLSLADQKDRAGFDARCTHTTYRLDGSIAAVDEVVISTADSSASSVMAAQAEAIDRLAGALTQTAP